MFNGDRSGRGPGLSPLSHAEVRDWKIESSRRKRLRGSPCPLGGQDLTMRPVCVCECVCVCACVSVCVCVCVCVCAQQQQQQYDQRRAPPSTHESGAVFISVVNGVNLNLI